MTSLLEPLIDTVTIVGVGLMGGSFGLALKAAGAANCIIGIDNPETLQTALEMGAIDTAEPEFSVAIPRADLIVIATPVHTVTPVLHQIAPYVCSEATVTDLASIKSEIASAGRSLLNRRFVPGHPMAGSERTGIANARANLYTGAAWAVTPDAECDESRISKVSALINACGANPVRMTPETHDRAAALISHLPHVVCYSYNHTVQSSPDSDAALALAAGSYGDLTRIAGSDPILWRDVFAGNKEPLLGALRAFRMAISELENAIEDGDPTGIQQLIEAYSATVTPCVRKRA